MLSVGAEIKVVTLLTDNQDGGYTMQVYNNEDELIEDHHRRTEYRKNPETGGYERVPLEGEELVKFRKDVLEEHDPYNNGYLDKDTIKVRINEDGSVNVTEPLILHAGQ